MGMRRAAAWLGVEGEKTRIERHFGSEVETQYNGTSLESLKMIVMEKNDAIPLVAAVDRRP